jgi:hypothetical protein
VALVIVGVGATLLLIIIGRARHFIMRCFLHLLPLPPFPRRSREACIPRTAVGNTSSAPSSSPSESDDALDTATITSALWARRRATWTPTKKVVRGSMSGFGAE